MLDVIIHPLISTKHGFFTRRGGASSGLFQGLNCGLGSRDHPETVQINRLRVSDWMQAPVQMQHQHHSADVVVVDAIGPVQKADAMVSHIPGLALGVLTADCQPVLFHDSHAGVIGAAHAGWKGAQSGVLEATVIAMERLGALARNITAVIGPCIGPTAYEVGPEFFEQFTDGNPGAAQFFTKGAGDRYMFDLPAYGLARLQGAGVGQATWVGACTYTNGARFYSYRRSVHKGQSDYGRLISCIRL